MKPTSRCKQTFKHVSVYADVPFEVAWPRVEDALLAAMLPMARELIAKQQAERDRKLGIPEYIAGDI